MANKEKLLASAQKYLSKGQIPKAIGEYQKLVGAFPKDVRNRQKLAELFSREKRNEEALTEYEAVAKHYTDTGFYLKSIAVYKQIQKIEPSRVDIYHSLAELNEKQGLIGNALTEYRNLISFYDKNGMHHDAIEVLQKMAALDPDNLNFSAKIAESLMASGRNEDALEKFQAIIETLAEKAEHIKVVKLYERFLEICPEEGTSRLPLARSLLKSGSPDKAIQVLKSLLKHLPEDPDINQCLTDAYVANQDFANARLTLNHLLKLKDDDLDLREYYLRICLDAGDVDRARDRFEEWKDTFIHAGRGTVLQDFHEELRGAFPGDPMVAGMFSAASRAVGDTAARDELDVAAVVSAESDEKPSTQKTLTAGLELDLDLDLEPSTVQAENAHTVAAAAETIAEKEVASVADVAEDIEIEIDIDLDDMDDFDLEFDEEDVFSDQDPVEKNEIKAAEEVDGVVFEEQELTQDEALDDAELQAFDTEAEGAGEGLSGIDTDELEGDEGLEELEEIEELDDLEELEELDELEALEGVEPRIADEPSGKIDSVVALDVDTELEEAEFYLQQGLFDDAERVVLALMEYRPEQPELLAKMAEINQGRQAAENESENTAFVDLMSDLQDDDLLAATDFLNALGGAAQGDDELSQKLVSELDSADTESHYNLGIAYKEMGLYDDAIAEFEKAAKDPVRHLDCTTLTGQCHMEAGATDAAMQAFKRGLTHEGITDQGRMILNFELGMLYQLNGQLLDALDYFQLVAEKDSFFRDVSVLIKNLRRELGLDDDSGDDGGPQGNRDRVSYV
ncbi:MAG: tetratricopeptide repeat protein [Desulfuromonadales bacterium]|nr:tetratricopeptide repeat protein [Desulfuromonadales bacterium]